MAFSPRPTRTVVVLPCRVNHDDTSADGCIHTVSDRGLMVSSARPPAKGKYVDIRRGALVVIGRVVWSSGKRFGVRTQDPINAERLTKEPIRATGRSVEKAPDDQQELRKEASHRHATIRADQSRRFASAFQFVCLATIAAALAGFGAFEVYHLLAPPLERASGILRGAVT
jgi:hypothetical protein